MYKDPHSGELRRDFCNNSPARFTSLSCKILETVSSGIPEYFQRGTVSKQHSGMAEMVQSDLSRAYQQERHHHDGLPQLVSAEARLAFHPSQSTPDALFVRAPTPS